MTRIWHHIFALSIRTFEVFVIHVVKFLVASLDSEILKGK